MNILRHSMIFASTLTLFFADIHGETSFWAHTVTTNAVGAWSVYALDVDGDSDVDILSASKDDDKIAWYENDGGEHFTPHVITTSADGAKSVHAADMDGDGDIDVISAATGENSQNRGTVTWYENDGTQCFTPHHLVTNAQWPLSGYAVDQDGDGDMDILYAEILGKRFSWCENDGEENFTIHVVDTGILMYTCVRPVDLDGDSDLDLVTSAVEDDLDIYEIAWYENDGDEHFAPHTITNAALGANWVHAVDLDDDGDIDVLSASYFDNRIAWYENDGNENFTVHTITTSAGAAWSVFAADLDMDDDIDVLSASAGDNRIDWYENDGSQYFTMHTIADNTLHACQVYATDIDGDSDIDVIAPSRYSNTVFWYENQILTAAGNGTEPGMVPGEVILYQNAPNPFNPSTWIEYYISEPSLVDISIFDVIGRKVRSLVDDSVEAGLHSIYWDGTNDSGEPLGSGVYFYRLRTKNDSMTRKLLLLK